VPLTPQGAGGGELGDGWGELLGSGEALGNGEAVEDGIGARVSTNCGLLVVDSLAT